MNCPFCGVDYNDKMGTFYYFFECGNAYDALNDMWADNCCSQPEMVG